MYYLVVFIVMLVASVTLWATVDRALKRSGAQKRSGTQYDK